MNQWQLMIFLTAKKTSSFAKAAEELGIAQSTVSREILALEREFQAPLFYRRSSGVSLTPAGTALINNATSFRDLYPKMLNDCRRVAMGQLPSLSISMGTPGSVLLQPVLNKLVQIGVDMPLTLHNSKYYYMLRMVNTGDVDVGVLLSQDADRAPNLVQHPLCSPQWQVAARFDHPYWQMSAADRSVLRDQVVIINAEALSGSKVNTMEVTSQYCVNYGLPFRQFLRANFQQDLDLMLQSGMGVAILPPFMAKHLPPEIRMSDELAVPYAPEYVLIHRPDNTHPGVQMLCDLCDAHFQGGFYG